MMLSTAGNYSKFRKVTYGEDYGCGDDFTHKNSSPKSGMLPEIFDLILNHLDDLSSYFLLDYIHLIHALKGNASLQFQLRDRLLLLNYTNRSLEELVRISSSTRILASQSNVISMDDLNNVDLQASNKRFVCIVDNHTDMRALRFAQESYVIYCAEAGSDISISISKLVTKTSNPQHIILDFPDGSISSGKQLFGILDPQLYTDESFSKLTISFPNVRHLEIDYMALDSFIYNVFTNFNTDNTKLIFDRFLKSLKLNFPVLQTIKFMKVATNEETCNFIDLSTLMLKKFKTSKIGLMTMFQIHSLTNWNLPIIKQFSGHRFKFDETTMTGSPERWVVSLRENMNLLRDIAINETVDATPYFRTNLIPDGVTSTKILNWIPIELTADADNYKTPLLILKSESLESLELKLLSFENSSTIMVPGLYLPHLKTLNMEQMQEQHKPRTLSNRRGSIIMTTSTPTPTTYDMKKTEITVESSSFDNYAFNQMNLIVFSSWNQLPNCEMIGIITSNNSNLTTHYIFNIENLKKILPSIDLKQSFPTFFDDQQKFIVV